MFFLFICFAFIKWTWLEICEITFDIVPTFELDRLWKCAHYHAKQLFDMPAYRSMVDKEVQKQTIMLGFFLTALKMGGYLKKANWSIFKNKRKFWVLKFGLKKRGEKLLFFDVVVDHQARGGGKTQPILCLTKPRKFANNEFN